MNFGRMALATGASPLGETLVAQLEQAINDVGSLYHRLVLLSGGRALGNSTALSELGTARNWPVINVSRSTAERLLDLPLRQRAVRLPQELSELIEATGAEVVLLDHIELLFTPELSQDPLRLLRGMSRNRTLVVSWPGTVEGGQLIHAEPGHPEFHRYEQGDAVVIDSTSAGTSATN